MAATVLGLTAVELAGDSALKLAAKGGEGSNLLLGSGMSAYALLGYLIFRSNVTGAQWGIINSYWNAVNNVVTPVAMMYLFGESYTTMQWCGIVVISVGILLLAS